MTTKFQSKFRNHMIVARSATFNIVPGLPAIPVPGLYAKFVGPNRIFDPDKAAKEEGWSDEDRDLIETWLLGHDMFMVDFFLAPGQSIPEEKAHLVKRGKREDAAKFKKCTALGIVDGDIVQCQNEATAGRDFCAEHDPETQKIVKGLSTTMDMT